MFNNKCFLIDTKKYNVDNSITIYKSIPIIENKTEYKDHIVYSIKFGNYKFNLELYNENKIKCFKRKAFIYDENDIYIKDTIIMFSFDKEDILKYYENTLLEITDILTIKKQQLEESIKSVNNQKHILYTNPEILFENI